MEESLSAERPSATGFVTRAMALSLLAVALAVIWWWNPAPEVAQRIHQIALGGLK